MPAVDHVGFKKLTYCSRLPAERETQRGEMTRTYLREPGRRPWLVDLWPLRCLCRSSADKAEAREDDDQDRDVGAGTGHNKATVCDHVRIISELDVGTFNFGWRQQPGLKVPF